VPKWKVKVNVLNLSDKVKILDLLKGGTSLAEIGCLYGKNELNICTTTVNSMHPENSQFCSMVFSLEPHRHGYRGLLYWEFITHMHSHIVLQNRAHTTNPTQENWHFKSISLPGFTFFLLWGNSWIIFIISLGYKKVRE
jgi:hypothetical protein